LNIIQHRKRINQMILTERKKDELVWGMSMYTTCTC